MKLSSLTLLFALLFSVSACGQTEGHYVSVRTVTDVFFTDTILNIVTTDTTFRDTLLGTGGGGVVGPSTQTLDTIDFDFLSTAANLPGATILNPDFTTEIPIPWSTSPVRTSARYTISGSDVSVAATGWYRVSGYLTTNTSTNQRYNGKVFLKKGGTLSDEWTATGYSRGSSSQDETTLYFEFYTQLTEATPFQIVQICEGGQTGASNAVTLNNTASRLHVIPLTQNFVELASGPAGAAGSNGLSAYEIWLAQGNTGTEADFLASLQGEQGPVGPSGGPVGPPGPPGATADTTNNGYYFRLFAGDEGSGDTYYDASSHHYFLNSGYAGIELFNPSISSTHRIYTLGNLGLEIEGGANFPDGFTAPFFGANGSIGNFGKSGTTLLIADDDGVKIRDAGLDSIGLVYEQNLSSRLKDNPRSIPDVGTVQEMIDAGSGGGGGGTPVIATYTTNATVTAVAGSVYHVAPPSSQSRTLTIDPSNLSPGDIILVTTNAGLGFRTIYLDMTSGDIVRTGNFPAYAESPAFYNTETLGIKLLWNGTNLVELR